jgi:pimeloyl-ACP methyl ester carboxylesterase
MRKLIQIAAVAGVLSISVTAAGRAETAKPTIVLVHGAFAESSSWDGVVSDLVRDGYPVVKSLGGPVILVGHSYGGTVITLAASQADNVKGLVYVAAFAPDVGESSFGLAGKFPGATLGTALAPPVTLPGGGQDLYIKQDRFPAQFAADVPAAKARLMAVDQRPITQSAGDEKAHTAAWKTIPSWSIYGSKDLNIPPAALAFTAQRPRRGKSSWCQSPPTS